jgi:hypothetical protein
VSTTDRFGALVEYDFWPAEERRRLELALGGARKWQAIEPHKVDFWEAFDSILLEHYPRCRFEEREQTGLDEWGSQA